MHFPLVIISLAGANAAMLVQNPEFQLPFANMGKAKKAHWHWLGVSHVGFLMKVSVHLLMAMLR